MKLQGFMFKITNQFQFLRSKKMFTLTDFLTYISNLTDLQENINSLSTKIIIMRNYSSIKLCQDFHCFWTFIRGQSVTQRNMGHGAPRYPPQDPGS